LITGTRLSRFL